MLEIHTLIGPSDAQFAFVIQEMRNSWESWEKGDSTAYPFELGAADAALCAKLTQAGPDHAKFLRQLPIHVAITAPAYWWREFDTYRIGVAVDDITQNSTSMMHVLGKQPFSADMFSFENLTPPMKAKITFDLNLARDEWIESGKRKGPDAHEWRAMLQMIPDSWNYRRGVSLNYAAARAMYHARRAHRLREWREFCAALLDLPYANLLIGGQS